MKQFTTTSTALLILLLLAVPTFAQIVDTDGDGVEDGTDLCPNEDASGFDANGDGCLDDPRGARHIEFWATTDLPLNYVVHEDGAPNVTDGSDFAAIDAAFQAWTSLPDAFMSATNTGTTPQAQASGIDGIHQVTFSDMSFNFGSAVLAVGLTTSFTEPANFLGRDVLPGQIVDADMMFNPTKQFRTSSWGLPNAADIQATATHEAGHLFGLAHSAVVTSTMFYVLPPGENARTLESDDELALFKAYPEPGPLGSATRLDGAVVDGGGFPVPGAAVFLISTATGDTTACDYTLPTGAYTFVGAAPGNYTVAIHPLDGSSGIRFLVPGFINQLVQDTAVQNFVPESWSLDETTSDDPTVADPINLATGVPVTGIDIITNVDLLPPLVQDQRPLPGSTGVGIDAAVLISFDEPIDDATIQGNFSLTDPSGGFVSGLASIFRDDRVISFTPNRPLDFGTDYTLTLGSGLSDRFGNPLGSDQEATFSTEPRPAVSINSLTPNRGVAGTSVVINGEGFDVDTANTTVLFDGIPATITSASSIRLIATVPSSIDVGSYQVSVTVAGTTNETSNDLLFSVLTLQEIARGTDVGVANLAGAPRALTTKQDGSLAYVGTSVGVSTVVVDPAQPSYLTSDPISQLSDPIAAIDITPDGRRVYALSRAQQRLHWIDADATSANFNEVLATIDLSEEPLGIAIEPAGKRAFVPMADGSVQIWDVKFDDGTYGNTFNRQIGQIDNVAGGAVGSVAFDPSNELLLLPTGAGTLAIYAMETLEVLAEVNVGVDPRRVKVDPAGKLAYVTDGNGIVSVVSLGDLAEAAANGTAPAVPAFKVQDIELGGTARGLAITPAALFAYVANREFDQVEVIDLDSSSSTFRTSAAEIPTGSNPVATSLSLDANYLFTLVEGANQLQVTAIGFGPVLRSVYPRLVQPGDYVAISGSGFTDPECATTVCPPGTGERIWFGDIEATNFEIIPTGDAFLNVRVPAGFTGGPVRVQVLGGGPPTAPDPYSNAIFLRALEPGDPFDPEIGEGLSSSISMDSSNGYDFDDAEEQGLTNVAEVSPNGEIVVLGGFGTIWILDGRTTSNTYNQELAELPMSVDERVEDVAFSADGSRLYVSLRTFQIEPGDGAAVVDIVDVNPNSPSFATVLGQIDMSLIDNCFGPARIYTHPAGDYLFIEDSCNDALVVADIQPGSLTENEIVIRPTFFGTNRGGDFHPGGDHLYTVVDTEVKITNTNPLSAGWSETNDFFPATTFWNMTPHTVAFTPDGARAMVLLSQDNPPGGANSENYYVATLDTSDPRNPVELYPPQFVLAGETLTAPAGEIIVSPQGHRMIVQVARFGVSLWDITAATYVSIASVGSEGSTDTAAGLAFTPDGERAYFTERQSSTVGYNRAQLLNFVSANSTDITVLSGDAQVGVAGQPLPAPVRIQITDVNQFPRPGVALQVSIIGGGSLPNGSDRQILSTNNNGIAEINWTLGPNPDVPGQTTPGNRMFLNLGSTGQLPVAFYADSIENPALLPLNFVQVLPADEATNVSATTSVQAIFSRPVDPATANLTAFFVHPEAGVDPVPAIVGLADNARRVSLTPITPLAFDTAYDVEITGGLQDTDANALTNPTTTSFVTSFPPALRLSSVSPPSATVGIELILGGRGFNADPALNTVFFNNVAVTAVDAGPDFLRVRVPANATTGLIRVEANSQVSSTLGFTVLVPNTSPLDEVVASLGSGSSTKGVSLSPDGTRAYTLSPEANLVIPIDMETFTSGDGIPVGNNPVSIDIHPDGTLAYVANFGSNDISVIDVDPTSGTFEEVVARIPTGNSPIDLAVSPQGDDVFVAHAAETFFNIIDGNSSSSTFNQVVASVGSGTTSKAVAIDPDGTRVFFGTNVGYFIVEQPGFETVVASVASGSSTKALKITPDGTLLIVLDTTGSVDIYDVNQTSSAFNSVVASLGSGSSTKGVSLSPDGTLLYLFQEDSDDILVFSLEILNGVSAMDEATTPPAQVAVNLVKTVNFGPDPSAMAFDPTGGGLAIVATAGDLQLKLINTSSVSLTTVAATIRVTPRTLNLNSNGRYVTGSIELPPNIFPKDIVKSTVILYSDNPLVGILADPDKGEITDENGNGIDELIVKFDRAAFQEIIPEGDSVLVVIEGLLEDGRTFRGEDFIRTKRPSVTFPTGGEVLESGATVDVTWTSPSDVDADFVDVYYSTDGGDNWFPIADKVPDTGATPWNLPFIETEDARVLVVLFENNSEAGGGISPAPFSITGMPVAVSLQDVQLDVQQGNAVLRWNVYAAAARPGFHVLRSEREDGNFERITHQTVTEGELGFEFEDEAIRGNRTYYYLLEESWGGNAGTKHGPFMLKNLVSNSLEQNYPNAFNPITNIRFSVAQRGPVKLVLYNVAGQRVKTLINKVLEADTYQVEWNGRDENGKDVSSGIYLYRMETSGFVASRKMTLVR